MLGCGRDDAADYREKGNELCREAAREVERLDTPLTADELVRFFERATDIAARSQDEFAALDPPDELEQVHERAVREGNRQERFVRDLIERMRASEQPQRLIQDELDRFQRMIRRGEALNRRLGLEECNEVGLPGGEGETSS